MDAAGRDVSDAWRAAIEHILQGPALPIMVLGPGDAGKSSFCRALLASAAREERNPKLIDTDVGQKLVGPPAAVTVAEAQRPEQLAALAFVGTTNPVAGFARVVRGTRHLIGSAGGLTIVNTSGILAGPGRKLKAAKIAAVRPSCLIALGQGPDLDQVLSDHASVPVIRLTTPPGARRKTRSERQREREMAFRRYFAEAEEWRMDVSAAVPADMAPNEEGLLIGLRDVQGEDIALGIVLKSNPELSRVQVLGPESCRNATSLVPGMLRFEAGFRETRAFRFKAQSELRIRHISKSHER